MGVVRYSRIILDYAAEVNSRQIQCVCRSCAQFLVDESINNSHVRSGFHVVRYCLTFDTMQLGKTEMNSMAGIIVCCSCAQSGKENSSEGKPNCEEARTAWFNRVEYFRYCSCFET